MVAYLDSSLVLRYVIQSETAIQQAIVLGGLFSSELLKIECQRVLHRCRMTGEFDDAALAEAYSRLEEVLSGVALYGLSEAVKSYAAGAFPLPVKTLDALHLATALLFQQENSGEKVVVFTTDNAMNLCARALGFATPLLSL